MFYLAQVFENNVSANILVYAVHIYAFIKVIERLYLFMHKIPLKEKKKGKKCRVVGSPVFYLI